MTSISAHLFDNEKKIFEVLKSVYGYDTFREGQQEVVEHVTAGGDALVLFPTGRGKSLCFQVPALCRSGVAIVVSPLIALMQDQVDALKQRGVAAEFLNSHQSAEEAASVRKALLAGDLKLLYVAPERLMMDSTLSLLANVDVSLLVVDECHAISQFGHDFRPEYRRLGELGDHFPNVPRIALTATADPRTRQDIIQQLRLGDAKVFTSSFDRTNISYEIVERGEARKQLLEFLKRHKGESGIVYCMSRKKVEETSEWLVKQGFKSKPYHAGMPQADRAKNQDAFLKQEGMVLAATVAFGMGIDKPDVRFVAHMDLPGSVEAYYQETGRAGRDGQPSEAWMAYGMSDVVFRKKLIDDGNAPEEQKRVERAKLNALLGICETAGCRRQAILAHFGEEHPGNCGNCDSCINPAEMYDGTETAITGMAAIYRTGQRFGTAHVIDVLLGKSNEKTKRMKHTEMPVFGQGKSLTAPQWQSVFRQLLAAGFLRVDHDAYGALKLEDSSRQVFKKEIEVRLRKDRVGKIKAPRIERIGRETLGEADAGLYEELRTKRTELSRAANVAPYMILADATLASLAKERPSSLAEMINIPGIGTSKLERFGQIFLDIILSGAVGGQSATVEWARNK